MDINNRRYTGSKYKLMNWIKDNLTKYCVDCRSFFDVFAGTGVVTAECLDLYDTFYVNDFLYSNNVVYNAFFGREKYRLNVIKKCCDCFKKDEALRDRFDHHIFMRRRKPGESRCKRCA